MKSWTILECVGSVNLINTSSAATHQFSKKKRARHVRVKAVAIAELSFF